jgi:tetratricopeptide (TPR) repeat protein
MPAIIFVVTLIFLFLVHPLIADESGYSSPSFGFGRSYVKDSIPDRLEPGRSYPVLITFKNIGLVTWESRTHRIGLVYSGDITKLIALPSYVEIPPQSVVPPGKDVTFALSLLPVGLPGSYSLPFSVVYRSAQGDNRATEIWEKQITIVPTDGISSPLNGSVAVETLIEGIRVFINGAPMGSAPCIIPDLSPGRYIVQIEGPVVKNIPLQVEKGVLTRVFIDNTSVAPRIENKKVGIASDGTLIGYIESNIILILFILIFVSGCIALMVHAVRLRREDDEPNGQKRKKKSKPGQDDDESLTRQERDLLDQYHNNPPIFEAETAAADRGSGSGMGQMKIHEPPKVSLKNVREASDGIVLKDKIDGKRGGFSVAGAPQDIPSVAGGVELSLQNFAVGPTSAHANISAWNRSSGPLKIEGVLVGPGLCVQIPVEVQEPVSDAYDMTISLKVSLEDGSGFLRLLRIPYNRGIALLARGVYEKAYEFFQDAIRKNPKHLDAQVKKAGILFKWGLIDEAEAVINQVLSLDPKNEGALRVAEEIKNFKTGKEIDKEKWNVSEKRKVPGFPDSMYDQYTPIRLLGKDTFASIILATRNDTGDIRALKIAHEHAIINPGLYTEISVLYQLRHMNVLKMFKAEFSPNLFLELECVSGVSCEAGLCRTLADMQPPLPNALSLSLIKGIASGVAYIHSKGVRHYHLSPKYILLDEPMTPKISGLIRESLMRSDSNIFDSRYPYAPEQINSDKFGKLGTRTDIFQMGAIWYWLLVGKMPFQDCLPDDLKSFTSCNYTPLKVFLPEYGVYDPLMKKLIALEKRDRYRSVTEFLADINDVSLINEDN